MNCPITSLVNHIVLILLVCSDVLFSSPTPVTYIVGEICDSVSQFRCMNGACIVATNRCNGIVDCDDSSDEMECCSKNQFSCAPNYCIEKSKVCNGISDCADNKDELKCQCVLPTVHPENTEVFVYNDVVKVDPGTVFNMNLFIEYNCTKGYTEIAESWRTNSCKMNKNGTAAWEHNMFLGCSKTCPIIPADNDIGWRRVCRDKNKKSFNCHSEPHIFPGATVEIVCSGNESLTKLIRCDSNGSWIGSFPECQHAYTNQVNPINISNNGTACSIESLTKPSIKILFTNDNYRTFSTTSGSSTMAAGTKVKILCAQEFYSSNDITTELVCANGKWTGGEIPICKMVCGERSGRSMIPSISHGIPTSTFIYPWIAAIYHKTSSSYDYICGGNIISPKLVISAAHCFTPTMSYLIGVGKKFRRFNHAELLEGNVQLHEISDIKYLGIYIGEPTYYENDIVALVVKTYIRFDVHIKPICIDYETRPYEIKENLLDLGHGYIAGWGKMENNQLSDELLFTSLPIIEDCRSNLKTNGRLTELNYSTSDKFCAGSLYFSTVCSGDSGHGLVFEKMINNRLRFYLYGVLSLTAENCSMPSYGFYTNVQNFKDKIKELIEEYED